MSKFKNIMEEIVTNKTLDEAQISALEKNKITFSG